MSKLIELWIRGVPRGQARPRMYRNKYTGKPVTHSPITEWKRTVIGEALLVRPQIPIDGPLKIDIVLFLPRPKRLLWAKYPDCPLPHPTKPDRDNLEKAILDALKVGGIMRDDSQAWSGITEKYYCDKRMNTGAYIRIEETEEPGLLLARAMDGFRFHVEEGDEIKKTPERNGSAV